MDLTRATDPPAGHPPTLRIYALVMPVWIVAAWLTWVGVLHLPGNADPPPLPWWAFALTFAIAELAAVRLQFGRNEYVFSLTELPLVVALIFVDPRLMVVTYVGGRALAIAVHRRPPLVKLLLNSGMFMLEGATATILFHMVARTDHPEDLTVWLGALVATTAANLVSIVIVSAAMSISDGRLHRSELSQTAVSVFWSVGNTSVGLLTAIILAYQPASILLLLPPAMILLIGYRTHTTERGQRRRIALLYNVTRAVTSSLDIEKVLVDVVTDLREAFNADFAEINVSVASERGNSLRVTCDAGGAQAVVETRDQTDSELAFLRQLAQEDAFVIDASTPWLTNRTAARPEQTAVVVALGGAPETVGWLLVADPLHTSSNWTRENLFLLEAVARQLSVSVERARLVRSLKHLSSQEDDLNFKVNHDVLTGLGNRLLLEKELEHATTKGRPASVLFIDIDKFKEINDRFGHRVGDKLLVTISQRLISCLRAGDVAIRLGGDEFVALLNDASLDDAKLVAARLMAAIDRPFDFLPRDCAPGASIGIAGGDRLGRGEESIVDRSDVAMYAAKRAGRGRVVVYSPEMGSEIGPARPRGVMPDRPTVSPHQ